MTDLNELQTKLDKTIEYVNNSQYDEAITELKEGIEKSDCSVCQIELGLLVADINHNRDICILESDTCKEEKEVVVEKIVQLKEDFKLAADENIIQ